MADAKRQLQIKTAGLKRVTKELAVYIREEDAESVRVKMLRASGADSHDLKHAVSRGRHALHSLDKEQTAVLQEDVLAEAAMMVPDTRQRLESAVGDLQVFLSKFTAGGADEELQVAKQAMANAEAALGQHL